MADIPSIFSSWKLILIVLGIIYMYVLFYDTQKALAIGQAVFIGLYRLVIGLFKMVIVIIKWLIGLFR